MKNVDQLHFIAPEEVTGSQEQTAYKLRAYRQKGLELHNFRSGGFTDAEATHYPDMGFSLHDMSPEVTRLFADYGIYTTTEPRDYAHFSEFRAERAHQRNLGAIADNVEERMARYSQYSSLVALGHAGTYLAGVFGNINAIHADNVHIEQPAFTRYGGIFDGKVVAGRMMFSVPNAGAGTQLSDALQILGHTEKGPLITRVNGLNVEVTDLSEHAVRSMERAVGALVAREDLRERAVQLPPTKARLSGWQAAGETFPSEVEARLKQHLENYRELKRSISAHYDRRPELSPVLDRDILGTSSAPAFQGMRAIMKALINEFPLQSARNTEQDPTVEDRPSIEQGIELRRDLTLRRPQEGPPISRSLTTSEQLLELSKQKLERTKVSFVPETLIVLGKIAGMGFSTILEVGGEQGPSAKQAVSQYLKDRGAWKEHQFALAARDARMSSVVRDINARVVLSRDQS